MRCCTHNLTLGLLWHLEVEIYSRKLWEWFYPFFSISWRFSLRLWGLPLLLEHHRYWSYELPWLLQHSISFHLPTSSGDIFWRDLSSQLLASLSFLLKMRREVYCILASTTIPSIWSLRRHTQYLWLNSRGKWRRHLFFLIICLSILFISTLFVVVLSDLICSLVHWQGICRNCSTSWILCCRNFSGWSCLCLIFDSCLLWRLSIARLQDRLVSLLPWGFLIWRVGFWNMHKHKKLQQRSVLLLILC